MGRLAASVVSAPVDVLSLFDTLIDECVCGDHNCEGCLHLVDARLAMAELIGADVEYNAANAAYSTAVTGKPRNHAWDRVLAARTRRAAALARCGGAS